MVDIMVALWLSALTELDRVSVKPHASPVLYAINYLLGELDEKYLPTLRAKGGLQSYLSPAQGTDAVDFSTAFVGIGATAPLWARPCRIDTSPRILGLRTGWTIHQPSRRRRARRGRNLGGGR